MTVIAYRNGIIAADKLTQVHGMKGRVTKIFRVGDALVGMAGSLTSALECVAWLRDGAVAKDIPAKQLTDDFENLMLVRDGRIWLYERGHVPFEMESDFYAIGSGAPYAMTAMHLGQTAIQAVLTACALNTGCGNGIDTLTLKETP